MSSSNFFEVNGIPLTVNRKITVNAQINITSTKMHGLDTSRQRLHLNHNGYTGVDFEVEVLFNKDEYYGNKLKKDIIKEYYKTMTVVTVVTEALDIPNDKYVIMDNKMKQSYDDYTVWSLKFQQQFYRSESEMKYVATSNGLSSYDQLLGKVKTPMSTNRYNDPADVIALKLYLQRCGKYTYKMWIGNSNISNMYPTSIDGIYDQILAEYIADLQKKNNLTVNGEFNEETKQVLLKKGAEAWKTDGNK